MMPGMIVAPFTSITRAPAGAATLPRFPRPAIRLSVNNQVAVGDHLLPFHGDDFRPAQNDRAGGFYDAAARYRSPLLPPAISLATAWLLHLSSPHPLFQRPRPRLSAD